MNFHQRTKPTFSNFVSGQREENTSFAGSASWVGVFHWHSSAVLLRLVAALCTKSHLGASCPCAPLWDRLFHGGHFTSSASCSPCKSIKLHKLSHRKWQLRPFPGHCKATSPSAGSQPLSSQVPLLQAPSWLPADYRGPPCSAGPSAPLSYPELLSGSPSLPDKGW